MTTIDYSQVDSFSLYYHRRDLRRALHGLSSMAYSNAVPTTTVKLPDGDQLLLPFTLEEASSDQMRLGGRLVLPLSTTHPQQPERFIALAFKIFVYWEAHFAGVRCAHAETLPRSGVDFQRGFLELLEASWGIFGTIEYRHHEPPACYLDDPAQERLMDGWVFPDDRWLTNHVKARIYTLRHRGKNHAAFYEQWVAPFLPFFSEKKAQYHGEKFIQHWNTEEEENFAQVYRNKAPFVTEQVLRQLLFDIDMTYQKIGACLIGLGKWTALTPDLGEQLLRYPWRFPFCFALACINNGQAAHFFQTFLNHYLPVPPHKERGTGSKPYPDIMAALLRYDDVHATRYAAPYFQPAGLWTIHVAYHLKRHPENNPANLFSYNISGWAALGSSLSKALQVAGKYFPIA
jgi:hypothetical protein